MPTEEELEQMVTEHIDKERAAVKDADLAGLGKGKSRKQDN